MKYCWRSGFNGLYIFYYMIHEQEYKELLVAKKNDEYRRKLEHSIEQLRTGKIVEKSQQAFKELEEIRKRIVLPDNFDISAAKAEAVEEKYV